MSTLTGTTAISKVDSPVAKIITPTVALQKRIVHRQGRNATQQNEENVIAKAFQDGRRQWIEEPVIARWAHPTFSMLSVLQEVNTMYKEWRTYSPGPFYPFSDPLWLHTCNWLRDAGLPWHNNNLNLPDEIDPSWPFHFKELERQAVLSKGARTGDNLAAGYVCDWAEANQYAIRALQQELRRQRPSHQPLLVGARIEASVLESAAQLYGLDMIQLGDDWDCCTSTLTEIIRDQRPVIFAASLANQQGEMDDFAAIQRLSAKTELFLHVDASRNFDYITTLSERSRIRLGLPRLVLQHPYLDDDNFSASGTDTILAATVVAGGMNWAFPPQVAVLKPRMLGTPSSQVEYVRGNDGTLAGSRDALGPLLVGLQERRFGTSGMRNVYARCSENRDTLFEMLRSCNVRCERPPASLDLLISFDNKLPASLWLKWGCTRRKDGSYLLTMQPSVSASDVMEVAKSIRGSRANHFGAPSHATTKVDEYALDDDIMEELTRRVAGWRETARHSAGYPLSHALYSALGPVIGHFLPLAIPPSWAKHHGDRILQDRIRSLGGSEAEQRSFSATFTTGSTMGNRVGLHTALANHPNAFVYYSSSSHYSIKKSVRDSDALTGRWHPSRRSRFAEIQADGLGRMISAALVKQAVADREWCDTHAESYSIVLLANLGTTFVGGCDDIVSLRQALQRVELDTAYVHVDGALDLGFSPCSIRLGVPSLQSKDGIPVVQGVTLSHHKAWGIMVSGEVICYNPKQGSLSTVASRVEPRIVFETWLAQRFYTPAGLETLHAYCLANANLLRRMLQEKGIIVRYNKSSLITFFERLPPWMVEEFHLAPEGPWVHYITMPHLSPEAVVHFVSAVAMWIEQFENALEDITPEMSSLLGCSVAWQRIRCHDPVSFSRTIEFVKSSARDGSERDTDAFAIQCKRGALSFAAFGKKGALTAVFLVGAAAAKTVRIEEVYLAPTVDAEVQAVKLVAAKGLAKYAELAGLTLLC
ncbi:MAG: hypothetical protein L6R38_007094 [Xanthoria sp. 2 TBL-2021]|nr:MAG: hypothetical protein L6R38_007094 [Xanthoria sp. 2 TBL-2021]